MTGSPPIADSAPVVVAALLATGAVILIGSPLLGRYIRRWRAANWPEGGRRAPDVPMSEQMRLITFIVAAAVVIVLAAIFLPGGPLVRIPVALGAFALMLLLTARASARRVKRARERGQAPR